MFRRVICIIIIIISFFKVDFYITFHNYKKPISVNQTILQNKLQVWEMQAHQN